MIMQNETDDNIQNNVKFFIVHLHARGDWGGRGGRWDEGGDSVKISDRWGRESPWKAGIIRFTTLVQKAEWKDVYKISYKHLSRSLRDNFMETTTNLFCKNSWQVVLTHAPCSNNKINNNHRFSVVKFWLYTQVPVWHSLQVLKLPICKALKV